MNQRYEIDYHSWGYWIQVNTVKIAGVVKAGFRPDTVEFVTPQNFGLQVAVMNRQKNHEIPSHYHLPVPRALVGTQEVLIIKQGNLRTDLYDEENEYLCSLELKAGDILILNAGGHGFVASDNCLFIEVKQGPFVEGKDKVIFPSATAKNTNLRMME